jgi:hypothetical protein
MLGFVLLFHKWGDIMNIDIMDYINSLEIIDTHEHLLPFEAQREQNDVISEYLTHYFSVDLVTAGLTLKQLDQVRGNEMSVIEKWNCIEQYWDRSRYTGYGQAIAITARDIYGIDEINRGSIMCKMYKNVYIDMCWAHIVSPVASRNILSEWLEFLPYNKINGFGGDYCFIDGVYGHQSIARRNIAEVLSEKARRGLFSVSKACEIGKAILYDNPAELFGI